MHSEQVTPDGLNLRDGNFCKRSVEHLTDETRAAFNEATGLTSWRGKDVLWRERGVEHAAFTIAWDLTGVEDARYPFEPRPDCETLAGRFELLTGHQPITYCGEYGWSP